MERCTWTLATLLVILVTTSAKDCSGPPTNAWVGGEKQEGGCQADFPTCGYTLRPVTDVFGAEVLNINLSSLDASCASALRQEAYMYKFLLFRDQDLSWQDQIRFTELLGTPFVETSAVNRKFHPKVPDARLGYFSNDPSEGLQGQGTEGWHVDGNIVAIPHDFTVIYCVNASKNGPTLVAPLKQIVDMFNTEERAFLDTIYFVSGHNSSVVNPLIYKHPNRNEDTIMLALGILSGNYIQKLENGEEKVLSKDETQYIQDILETKILGSNLIYTHQYRSRDLLLLNNPSVAHIAGPGSQSAVEISGLRLMHRSTVRGTKDPSKQTSVHYECDNFAPFEDGYCIFSLKDSVFYPRYGIFDARDVARQRCKGVNSNADLAVIWNENWSGVVKRIIERTGVPHWTNGTNPRDEVVFWGETQSDYTNWNVEQPNDHDGPEECVVIGPLGEWYDLPCAPKTKKGSDPGPVITWSDGIRRKYNVFPLCGVQKDYV
ncbi:(S)-phenoxypropionate/alpha-ketoglutarate-dioxygenase-like [Argopecten irradians]|uniref:(S)-phenoxypropionate/alpha-ketoglutarate- dioxygenase-like n=1 Tax=Argopecten irradians TaxID=31199 RepID=UPI0037125C08